MGFRAEDVPILAIVVVAVGLLLCCAVWWLIKNKEKDGYLGIPDDQDEEKSHYVPPRTGTGPRIGVTEQLTQDDFDLMTTLGRGSYGKVLQVRKKDTKEILAMKVLNKRAIIRQKEVIHTRAERNVLQRVGADHPFLVGLRYSFQTEAKLYLVCEFVQGGELFRHLQRARRFSEDRARFYAAEIILALEHLHSNGIIYRDLKPENILLDAEGHIKITDFGLAKEGLTTEAKTRTFCGTPEYLAPEILRSRRYGFAVDWWCLGTVVYEMLCGMPPFYSKDVKQMYRRILRAPLRFPSYVSPNAKDILTGVRGMDATRGGKRMQLLNRDQHERLGAGTHDAEPIKNHPFFAGVDWKAMLERKIAPPFKPRMRSLEDTSNFDRGFTRQPALVSPSRHGKAISEDQQVVFQGFTFEPGNALQDTDKEEEEEEKGSLEDFPDVV